jgi:hypothetical protein
MALSHSALRTLAKARHWRATRVCTAISPTKERKEKTRVTFWGVCVTYGETNSHEIGEKTAKHRIAGHEKSTQQMRGVRHILPLRFIHKKRRNMTPDNGLHREMKRDEKWLSCS